MSGSFSDRGFPADPWSVVPGTGELVRQNLHKLAVSNKPDKHQPRDERTGVHILLSKEVIQHLHPATTDAVIAPSSSQHLTLVARRATKQLSTHIPEPTATQQPVPERTRRQTRGPTGGTSALSALCRIFEWIPMPSNGSTNVMCLSAAAVAAELDFVVNMARETSAWVDVHKMELPNLDFPPFYTSPSLGNVRDIQAEP